MVSIHAPTWGATGFGEYQDKELEFQSTHPHGVRLGSIKRSDVEQVFQSTHPHGVRLYPTRLAIGFPSFNPRTHMGCDCRGEIRRI